MRSFQHIEAPLRLYSGPDSLAQVGRELHRIDARRTMVFCGATLARSNLLDLVLTAIGDSYAGTFAMVRAHSPLPSVLAGVDALRQANADAIVAVGGGSAVVTARAASILLAETGNPQDLATLQDAGGRLVSPKLLAPKIPNLVVPTTPTTAAVKAGTAVLDPVTQRRLALFDPKTRAQAIFIHPDLLASAPVALMVSSSLDTLTLAVEGLVSRTRDPIAVAMLMQAIRLISSSIASPGLATDSQAQSDLMMAAVLCGRGTDFTGAGIATVLGHAIGAMHGTENGITKAIVLPHVLQFNAEAAPIGMADIAAALALPASHLPAGEQVVSSQKVLASFESLLERLHIPRRLRDVDIPRQSLRGIAERGMDDWFLKGNPRPVQDAAVLEAILQSAW